MLRSKRCCRGSQRARRLATKELTRLRVPPVIREQKWEIGTPDNIITMLEEHTIQAEGYVPYEYSILPYMFTEDTWVQAIEIMPDNPRVVHHCNLLMFDAEKGIRSAAFITGKVPGSQALIIDDGVAVHVPKGSVFALQIHYTTTGKEEKSRISVGLRHARGTVNKAFRHILVTNNTFEIPPGDPNHAVDKVDQLDVDTTGIGLFSHMHVRGKDMTFTAHTPDGKSERLLTIPNYSFDWQMGYEWAKGEKKFPAGTRFEVNQKCGLAR